MDSPSVNPAPEHTLEAVEEVNEKDEKRERHRAVVTRIGTEPLLTIDGLGEFRFAYRNVKKKPGEQRPYLNVGDEVECRLTKAAVPKAVSVRVVRKTQPQNTYVHNPYEVTELPMPVHMPMPVPVPACAPVPVAEEPSLFDFLGGADGISSLVDSALNLDDLTCCASVDKVIADYEEDFYPTKGLVHDDVDCHARFSDEEEIIIRQRSHSAPPVY